MIVLYIYSAKWNAYTPTGWETAYEIIELSNLNDRGVTTQAEGMLIRPSTASMEEVPVHNYCG